MKTRFIDAQLLTATIADARQRPRRRANYNFHIDEDFPAHRLLNAIEPDSWLPPHRHLASNKDETILVLAGQLGVVIFDADGKVSESRLLIPGGECCGVDIPHGTWHTVVALVSGTVLFETKAGPYLPITPAEIAPWAPAEICPEQRDYAQRLRRLFVEP